MSAIMHLNWKSFTDLSRIAYIWKHQTHYLNAKVHSLEPGIGLNP
jgi:hypothetical protein